MIGQLALHLTGMAPLLSVFLKDDATVTAFKGTISNIANDAVTVMEFAIPVVAIFRIMYRFAESKEGSLMVLLAEVVIIIFLSFGIGSLLHILITTQFFQNGGQ